MSARYGDDLDKLLSNDWLASDIHRIDDARRNLIAHLGQGAIRIAEEYHSINETRLQVTNQFIDQQENIRRMLDPINDIRKHFMLDTNLQHIMNDFTKTLWASDVYSDALFGAGKISAYSYLEEGVNASLLHAQEALKSVSLTGQIQHFVKSFQDANQQWMVPNGLVESIGAIKALQESVGSLSLPVIDWPSAATLASLLGQEGIREQLTALGIHEDGMLSEEREGAEEHENEGGLSRRTLDLLTLLSFIAMFLIPLYQEISSAKWQEKTDAELIAQREMHQKYFEALSRLVEKAIEKEARGTDDRFVVLDRVALVRSAPVPGSPIVGKLLPREVVKHISEQGKWIQIEYYDWLRQDYWQGWSLKKYFKRVPIAYSRHDQTLMLSQRDFENFAATMENPPKPEAALLKLMARR